MTQFISRLVSIFLFTLLMIGAKAAPPGVHRLSPPYWYCGLGDTTLEIIMYAENIDLYEVEMKEYDGVTYKGKSNTANRHIAYLQVVVSANAKPGYLEFKAIPNQLRIRYTKAYKFTYELKERNPVSVNNTEPHNLYFIKTDRFVNGDEKNDNIRLRFPYETNRTNPNERHGGDLAGIIQKADYIKGLNIDHIVISCTQECDAPGSNLLETHLTDHYKTDPRYGSNDQVKKLIQDYKKKQIGVVLGVQINHISTFHWMFQTMDTHWFNHMDSMVLHANNEEILTQPFENAIYMQQITGWKNQNLPDLNQKNPHIRAYLNQMLLWWLETTGADGFYFENSGMCDPEYLAHCITLIEKHFPGKILVPDIQLYGPGERFVMREKLGLNNIKNGWVMNNGATSGLVCLSSYQDLYQSLYRSHLSRQYQQESPAIWAYSLPGQLRYTDKSLLNPTLRLCESLMQPGVFMIQYGDEWGMKNSASNPFPDFPGGFKSDRVNKFNTSGLQAAEQEHLLNMKTAMAFKQKSGSGLNKNGMAYIPQSGVYVHSFTTNYNTLYYIGNNSGNPLALDSMADKNIIFQSRPVQQAVNGKTAAGMVIPDNSYILLSTKPQ